MSNSKQSNPAHRVPPYRRPIIVVSFLIILVVAVAVTIIIFMSINHTQETLPEPPQNTPSPIVPTQPDDDEDKDPEPEDKVNQYEGEDPNELPELTGRVAYKGVNRDQNFESLTISASIDQYLLESGTCTLSLKNPAGTVVYTASLPAQPDVTTSACGPFEVPISDFSPGAYPIEITVTSDGKTGLITDTVQL